MHLEYFHLITASNLSIWSMGEKVNYHQQVTTTLPVAEVEERVVVVKHVIASLPF